MNSSVVGFVLEAARKGASVDFDPQTERWELTRDYTFVTRYGKITVHAGFQFDLSSIPRVFWPLVAPFELSIEAPLLHDFLYRRGGKIDRYDGFRRTFTRKEADGLFLDEMEKAGIPWLRRRAAYLAVRAFGGGSWKG